MMKRFPLHAETLPERSAFALIELAGARHGLARPCLYVESKCRNAKCKLLFFFSPLGFKHE